MVVASNGYPLAYEGVKLPAKTDGDIITYYAGAKLPKWPRPSQTADVFTCYHNSRHRQRRQNIIYNELNKQNTEGLFYRNDIGSKANNN
ncbi:MAG: hypothetical protein ACLVGS_07660 [Streptococcus agalactiae]